MSKLLKITLLLLISLNIFSYDTTSEIELLNKEFNTNKDYPILIFNKDIIRKLLTGDKEKDLETIKTYIFERFNIKLEKFDAETILDYHTVLNSSASALPFTDIATNKYRFCAVFPSGSKLGHSQEIRRILGITSEINPYPVGTVEKVLKLLSLKELKLISLYHELSHCLDKTYIPDNYNTDSHHIHLAESFAETLAMLFVTKRFNFNNIALRRSILRGIYTKYMGKHIANDEDLIVMHPSAKEMGIIYYLSPTLLNINNTLLSYDFRRKKFTTEELANLALENTKNYSFDSRTFAALINYLKNGEEESHATYMNLAASSPELFYPTYLRLKKETLFLNDLNFLLNRF